MARPRTADRTPVREEIRTESVQRKAPRKQRTRRGVVTSEYAIAQDILAALWQQGIDLQWNVDSLLGQPAAHQRANMARQGWEPVTGEMWDGLFNGMFMPKGHKGEINVGGLVLEWRPRELTEEARGEELQAARHARGVEERKISSGAVDNVDPRFMNTEHAKAKANTFLRKEMGPVPGGQPIPN